MNPNEKFIQYYRNSGSFPEIIDLEKEEEFFGEYDEILHKLLMK